MAPFEEGLGHRAPDALGDPQALLGVRVDEQDGELVAAVAREGRPLVGHCTRQEVAELLEDRVGLRVDRLPSVVDGDENDLRFKDEKGVIVGLVEKGLAKKDETGFVVEPWT